MLNAKIQLFNAYEYLADESSGLENIGFTKKDTYNYIHEMKASQIETGDSQNLVNYFENKGKEEGLFY